MDPVWVLIYNDDGDIGIEGLYRSQKGMIEGFKRLLIIEVVSYLYMSSIKTSETSIKTPIETPKNSSELPKNAIYSIKNTNVLYTLDELIEYFLDEEQYHLISGRILSYSRVETINS